MPDIFDLSILIVNWNGGTMMRALLDSIERFGGALNVQTIVVDNASTDGSAEMIAAEFPQVTLIRNAENRGFARGNNQAAAVASAPLILLLNNDTIVREGALQVLVEYLDGHPDVVATAPKLMGADDRPQRTGRNLPTIPALLNTIQFLKWTGFFRAAYKQYRRGNFDPNVSAPVGQLAAAALAIRAKAFNACGGFDEQYPFGVEDVDLCMRLATHGSIHYLSEAAIDHLGRVSSRANRGFVYRGYECGWARYIKKHHGPRAAVGYKILVTIDMPVRVAVLGIQWMGEFSFGKPEKADRARALFYAATDFMLHGLWQFWHA